MCARKVCKKLGTKYAKTILEITRQQAKKVGNNQARNYSRKVA